MLGLPDIVGWDTLKTATRSYHNETYTITKVYDFTPGLGQGEIRPARAHEFFDRVAHFHDQRREQAPQTIPRQGQNLTGAQALRSLPDQGKLLDKHFTVKTRPVQGSARLIRTHERTWARHLTGELAREQAQRNAAAATGRDR